MRMPRNRFQQLKVAIREDKHLQEGHLCLGTKIYFLVYVMPVIIMVIKLQIAEHILDLDIIGVEEDMKVLNTRRKEITAGDHRWVPTETIIGLRHQTMTLNVTDVTILDTQPETVEARSQVLRISPEKTNKHQHLRQIGNQGKKIQKLKDATFP